MDVMDKDSVVRLCNSAFTGDDIEAAKNLLFDSITSAKRKIVRRRDGKSQRDLNDIISLFKGTDPEEMPVFVARELQKLPAITFDHIDVTRLLKDLLLFQNELRTIKECYITKKEFSALKEEVLQSKQSSPKHDQYVNYKRGGSCLKNSFCMESGPMGLPHLSENTCILPADCETVKTHAPSPPASYNKSSISPQTHSTECNKGSTSLHNTKTRLLHKPVIT
ncbi:unnamed protein product [Leptidea sinapis]|uniref:Mutant cadherin n=1 Tax=Leptidea sinapis TaxID=189913 RepID=A0A5E4Q628_9NEOP|nr:unnamed protein product [Leptidea sinapis]